MKVALDTNILSAIWVREPVAVLLSEQLFQLKGQGTLIVSPFTYVESRACPNTSEAQVTDFFSKTGIALDYRLPGALWSLASERFAVYADRRRTAGGHTPRRILADFLIGAHAVLSAERLMTLDATFYKRNYPELQLHPLPMQ